MSGETSSEQRERAALIAKLAKARAAGPLKAANVARMLGHVKVPLVADRVAVLIEAGVPEAEAKKLGGWF